MSFSSRGGGGFAGGGRGGGGFRGNFRGRGRGGFNSGGGGGDDDSSSVAGGDERQALYDGRRVRQHVERKHFDCGSSIIKVGPLPRIPRRFLSSLPSEH